MVGGLGDLGDRLHAGGAGSDDPDAFAREGDQLMGPAAGVVHRPGEVVDAGIVRLVGDEQRAGGTNQEPGRRLFTVRRFDGPALRRLVPTCIGDPRVELDVLAQIEPVGDVVEVGEHIGARGLGLFPHPLVDQFLAERVGVERRARRVDPGAGVAVVPPGAAHPAGAVECTDRQAHRVAQAVEGVEPAEACTDDDGVVVRHGYIAHLQLPSLVVTVSAPAESSMAHHLRVVTTPRATRGVPAPPDAVGASGRGSHAVRRLRRCSDTTSSNESTGFCITS